MTIDASQKDDALSSKIRIVIVDPNFSRTSPSLKSFLTAIPHLESGRYSVTAWCSMHDADFSHRVTLKIPLTFLPSPFNYWLFSLQATLAHLFWILTASQQKRHHTLFISVGNYSPLAEAAIIQFSQRDWMRCLKTLPVTSLREAYELCTRSFGVLLEWLHQRSPFVRRFIVVSEGIAQEFLDAGVPHSKIYILPNTFDASRFCHATRELYRSESRAYLNFLPSDIVFCFCSMGHFRRKGLDLAFQALQLVREHGHPEVKFILIGGDSKKIEDARKMAEKYCQGSLDWIQFLGHQDFPERLMSAADALIFPSHSEALALVEIEAAALGLRLYLTPHHGSEMILEDPANGRFLDWEIESMAKTLIEEIHSGAIRNGSQTYGKVVPTDEFAKNLYKALTLA